MKRAVLVSLLATIVLSGCVTESNGRISRESPTDAAAYNYQLGVEYLRNGKLRQARERLESSVRQNPDVAQTHFTLAILYQRVDEPDLAGRSFRNAIRIAPNDAAVQNTYAIYLCGKRDFAEAERYFIRAARNPLYQTPAVALTNAGVCMREKPDLAAAEKYFRDALQVDGDFRDALLELALVKYETGNAMGARAFVQRLMAVGEPSAQALWLGWQVERELGDQRAADEFADELRERFPDSAEMRRIEQSG
ncbi:MAG: type IV pilus biogenesis/stability protein PilW [Pseudomonadota bacterium]